MGRRLWALALLACVRCDDTGARLNDDGVRLRAAGDLAAALEAFQTVISSPAPPATRHAAHLNALALLSAAHFGIWTARDVLTACRPRAQQSPAIAGMLAHVAREHAIWNLDADDNRRKFELAVQSAVDGGEAPQAMHDMRPVLGHLTLPFDGIGPQYAAAVGGFLDRNSSGQYDAHAAAHAAAPAADGALPLALRRRGRHASSLHIAWISSDFQTASVGYSLLAFFAHGDSSARPADTCVFTATSKPSSAAAAHASISWQLLDTAAASERARPAGDCEWQLVQARCSNRSLGPEHTVHDRLACGCDAFLEYRPPPVPPAAAMASASTTVRNAACVRAGAGAAVSDDQLRVDLLQHTSAMIGRTPAAESVPGTTAAWHLQPFHVAVDLNGKTLGQRPLLWQPLPPASAPPRRLAPLAVLYLGFAETMGRASHDYVLLDQVTQPPETASRAVTAGGSSGDAGLCALAGKSPRYGHPKCVLRKYSERLLYVPSSYHALALPPDACPPRPTAAAAASARPFDHLVGDECIVTAPDGSPHKRAVVIGFLHAASKLNARALSAAVNVVLRSGPCAVLVLLQPRRGTDIALLVLREAAARGLPPHRIQLVGAGAASTDNRADTRSLLPWLDVFLDTLPYGAHSSAADALAYGVPVVTIAGEEWAGRVAAGFLHVLAGDPTNGVRAAVLQSLVTHSWTEFEAVAVALARSPTARAVVAALLRASACDEGGGRGHPSIWQPAAPLRTHVDAGLAAAFEAYALRAHRHQQEEGAAPPLAAGGDKHVVIVVAASRR